MSACRAQSTASTPAAQSSAGLALATVTIRGHGRSHRFTVEVAASDAEQEKGMMFRQSLAPDGGMIFPFPTSRVATFWMKDTLIPLDILFYRADGNIARIEHNAVPMSHDLLSSNEAVVGVLEVAGGRTAELGIVAGDRLELDR